MSKIEKVILGVMVVVTVFWLGAMVLLAKTTVSALSVVHYQGLKGIVGTIWNGEGK